MIRKRLKKEDLQEIKRIDMKVEDTGLNLTFDIRQIGNQIPSKIPIINSLVQNLKVVIKYK